MKTSMLVGLLAAFVGVGAAGWVLLGEGDDPALAQSSDDASPTLRKGKRTKAGGSEGRRDGDLEDRVAQLESEVDQLRRQLKVISMRSGAPGAFAEGPEGILGDPQGDPEFQDSVRDIVADEREREREAEMDRRRERFQQRSEELLDDLVAQANISGQQREKISTLWTEERDQMFSMFMEARDGERDFGDVRKAARSTRESTDEQAKNLLSDEQYEVYSEMRPRGPGGWGGRGGGRGQGRGGPPRGD
jgi:hypothetical protein